MTTFIPKHSTFTLTIDGVRVINYKLESSQARRLSRAINQMIESAKKEGVYFRDSDIVDIFIAALYHEQF